MRRIVLSIAASLDGFIARRDDAIDWLPAPNDAEDYGMGAFIEGVDTIVWGRRTWDVAQGLGGIAPFGERMRHVVLTRHGAASQERVEFTAEDAATLARRLRAQPGKDVWLMGGGQVVSAFLAAGELDEIIVHVIPVLLGDGIPLAPGPKTIPLRLRESRAYADGVVMLHYEVGRPAARGSSL